jgi:hypothetical protein
VVEAVDVVDEQIKALARGLSTQDRPLVAGVVARDHQHGLA